MKSFTQVLLFTCLVATILSTLLSGVVQAQAISAGASGSTTSITGIITTQTLYFAGDGSVGKYLPYYATNEETRSAGAVGADYCIVARATGSSVYAISWNFTAGEAPAISSWLSTLPKRNNVEVTFTATWNSGGRFAIETAAWTLTQGSLFPYGVTGSCNASAMIGCLVGLELSLPDDCVNTIIPYVKGCAKQHPDCLALYGKTLNLVHGYCQQQRGVIDTLFCTDGKAGGDVACKFANEVRPTGVFSDTLVVSVDADGIPTGGTQKSKNPPPSSAGSLVFSSIVAVSSLVFVIFATML